MDAHKIRGCQGDYGTTSNSTEAGKAWEVNKVEHGITTGTTRSSWQKTKFLIQLADSGKAPKWMNQWLKKGKVPPGYTVDRFIALFDEGLDIPSNMRIKLISDYKKPSSLFQTIIGV